MSAVYRIRSITGRLLVTLPARTSRSRQLLADPSGDPGTAAQVIGLDQPLRVTRFKLVHAVWRRQRMDVLPGVAPVSLAQPGPTTPWSG
jgi:hypothetical protein